MPRCSVNECELPGFCHPVLVVRDLDPAEDPVRLHLPLTLCCRHARAGDVERYLSPSSVKRLDRELRARGHRPDWTRSSVVVAWTPYDAEPRIEEPA